MNGLYVHSRELGYGRMGVDLIKAVERQGVEVFDDLPNPQGSGAQKYIPHVDGKSATCAHVAWLSTPGHCRGWWKGQTKSILTMWESTILPEPFRESLDVFDTVIVPSQQNFELFSRYHQNVKYVPLGIDPQQWAPTERPTLDEPYFTFLISGGGHRKGSELVIDAFRKVFDGRVADGPAPRLFVHSAKASDFPKDERIHLITGKLTDDEERALYAMAHCYVQPSRGEGFGMRPLQAIAQGCPTIATNAHGHAAYGDLITYPLGWTLTETPPQSFHHGPAGSWWEPNFDDLCQAMEDVYLHYNDALEVAKANSAIARMVFTWDVAATRYLDAIGRENLELPDIEPVEWVEPEIRRYLVRVNNTRFFEAGGLQYLLEPGKDYWEPADVKRVLYDGGNLDISCLPQNLLRDEYQDDIDLPLESLETGLTPEQLAKVPEYSGHAALCPTCTQRLNTNRPTLEEIESLSMPRET
jgi:glycosyltransferase involved in cell wall biosynthesis